MAANALRCSGAWKNQISSVPSIRWIITLLYWNSIQTLISIRGKTSGSSSWLRGQTYKTSLNYLENLSTFIYARCFSKTFAANIRQGITFHFHSRQGKDGKMMGWENNCTHPWQICSEKGRSVGHGGRDRGWMERSTNPKPLVHDDVQNWTLPGWSLLAKDNRKPLPDTWDLLSKWMVASLESKMISSGTGTFPQ